MITGDVDIFNNQIEIRDMTVWASDITLNIWGNILPNNTETDLVTSELSIFMTHNKNLSINNTNKGLYETPDKPEETIIQRNLKIISHYDTISSILLKNKYSSANRYLFYNSRFSTSAPLQFSADSNLETKTFLEFKGTTFQNNVELNARNIDTIRFVNCKIDSITSG